MPIVINTPYQAHPIGWEEVTGPPFPGITGGARALWLLPDDTVLVGPSTSALNLEVAIYDPSLDSWTSKADFPTGFNTPRAVFHPTSGKPVMVGSSSPSQGHIYEYTSGTDSWARVATWSPNHRNCGFANLDNGDIIAFSSQQTTDRLKVTSWDGTSFTALAPVPTPTKPPPDIQGRNQAVRADNGDIYSFGFYGYLPSGPVVDSIYKYQPAPIGITSIISTTLVEPMYSPSIARLSGNRVMIIGGSVAPSGYTRDVYIFDMTSETISAHPFLFAEPAVSGGLDAGLGVTSGAVTLADGRVMIITNDNRTFITTGAP